jgi:hypothetical protein
MAPQWPHSESQGPGCATTWPAVRRRVALRSSIAGVAFRADGCLPSGGGARSESVSASCVMVGWALSIGLKTCHSHIGRMSRSNMQGPGSASTCAAPQLRHAAREAASCASAEGCSRASPWKARADINLTLSIRVSDTADAVLVSVLFRVRRDSEGQYACECFVASVCASEPMLGETVQFVGAKYLGPKRSEFSYVEHSYEMPSTNDDMPARKQEAKHNSMLRSRPSRFVCNWGPNTQRSGA